MKRMWKKTWSLILALSLVMSLLAVGAAAEELSVARIGDNDYETLEAAVKAATSGDVITLLSSCSGTGIGTFVNTNDGQLTGVKDFTIDFGGFTYNVTGPAVGSAGYLSQGFHLEKGANVTLKNGTITSTSGSGVQMLVQNYCNLTLQDITLDGTNLDGGTPYYTLSNNCGAVNINGNTTITAKNADGIAFDACWAPNNGYAEGTQVTLDTTGSIAGNIEFDLWGTNVDTDCLTTVDIKNCNMTGSFLTSTLPEAAKTNITISGGTFSSMDALKYLTKGANVNVKLAADEHADVTIPADTTVAIDLNGKNLANVSSDTITNNGTLTITNTGTVDNIANGKAAVFNNGTATLSGGTYTRSEETGSNPTTGGDNTYYTILNHGTMIINSGVSVTQNGHYSSLLDNGYYNYTTTDSRVGYVPNVNAANPSLTVNGGSFSGGINTIKNDDGASVEINGGSFTNATQHALFNANVAIVNGGTFESTDNYAVYNKQFGGEQDIGQMTITGGYFKGLTGDVRMDSGTVSITGGYYTSDPSAYVAAGYKAASGSWTLDSKPYSYKVTAVPVNNIESATAKAYNGTTPDSGTDLAVSVSGSVLTVVGKVPAADTMVTVTYTKTDGTTGSFDITKSEADFVQPDSFAVGKTTYSVNISGLSVMPATVAVQSTAPQAASDLPASATEEQKTAATTVVNTIAAQAGEVKSEGLAAAVTTQVETTGETAGIATSTGTVITPDSAAATDALSNNGVTVGDKEVVVVAQPYLDIKVTGVETDAKDPTTVTELTLEIEPKYNVVAVVKDTGASIPAIDTTGTSKNAAVVAEAQPMTVTTPVTVSIPLPDNMTIDVNNFFVKHDHTNANGTVTTSYYKATITGEAPRIATFTVPNFSTFTFTSDTRTTTIEFPDETSTITLANVGDKLPTATKSGYTFKGWTFTNNDDGAAITGGPYTTMTSALLDLLNGKTVTAVPSFTVNSSGGGVATSSFTLTFNTNGGSAIASVSKTSGTTVDLTTYEPTRDGYDFAGWYSDNTLTTKVTSIKLTNNTTVYAKWISANPFTDVESGAYYHDAVLWAVGKGVTNGTTATTFSPDDTCTRAQAVTFLWRAMGSPEPTSSTCQFTDVDSSDYYYKAVLWAVEKGVTTGTTDTTFSPADTVTRGQAVTFLYRAAEAPAAGTTNPFTDVKSGDYYYDAVLWAVGKNITEGVSATTFIPANDCTRAQIVTFLWRYLSK